MMSALPLCSGNDQIGLLFEIVPSARVQERFAGELFGADGITFFEVQTGQINPEFRTVRFDANGTLDQRDCLCGIAARGGREALLAKCQGH